MDRPNRFDSKETSKYYEASLQRSRTSRKTSTIRTWSTEQSSRANDLHELQDYLRRPQPQATYPRRRDTELIESPNGWPSFVVEKPAASPGFTNEDSIKTPELRYDQNFLHPPTPKRDSFVAVGLASRNGADDDDTSELRPRRLSVNLERSSRFGWWTLCLLLVTVVMITLTATYSNGSAKNLWQDRIFTTSSSNAILILRVMTEACALLLAALVVVVVEDLQWALASRPQGVDLLHFIGLDSGTGVWGLLRLLATADWNQKYSSLFR